ncbi:pentatricopeptide repeat-containing protein At1g18485-like [Wolffia australiana]
MAAPLPSPPPPPEPLQIRHLSRRDHPSAALLLLRATTHQSNNPGFNPSPALLRAALRSCAELRAADPGREIHGFLLRRHAAAHLHTATALVSFYANCGLPRHAHLLFTAIPDKDTVAWTALLAASDPATAPSLLLQMLLRGLLPTAHTLTAALKTAPPRLGPQLHAAAVKRALHADPYVGSALVAMYAAQGAPGSAERAFRGVQAKDAACFNSLMASRRGDPAGVVGAFIAMAEAGVGPSQATHLSLLAAQGMASQAHALAIVSGALSAGDGLISAGVISAYAKAGDLPAAKSVFHRAKGRGLALWKAMIASCSLHGEAGEALALFEEMTGEGVRPDEATFVSVLWGCAQAGMVEEGTKVMEEMEGVYGVVAGEEHYGCMAEMLGRAGRTEEARAMAERGGRGAWGAVLRWCGERGEVEAAEEAAERLLEMGEGGEAGVYVALAEVYARWGRWEEAAKLRREMERRGVRKEAGRSWTEVKGVVHGFRAGEGSVESFSGT